MLSLTDIMVLYNVLHHDIIILYIDKVEKKIPPILEWLLICYFWFFRLWEVVSLLQAELGCLSGDEWRGTHPSSVSQPPRGTLPTSILLQGL